MSKKVGEGLNLVCVELSDEFENLASVLHCSQEHLLKAACEHFVHSFKVCNSLIMNAVRSNDPVDGC